MPLALVLSGCTGPAHKYNQKITVTLETPNGEVSGYTVQHVEDRKIIWGSLSGAGVSTRIKGEAVVVEVAPGRYLFVLCNGVDSVLSNVFGDVQADTFDKRMEKLVRSRERRTIPERLMPDLATFIDPADPATGVLIKSVRDERDLKLDQFFGDGVRLKSMTVEVTDEPLTQGRVAAVLPWYGHRHDLPRETWQGLPDVVGYILNMLSVDR